MVPVPDLGRRPGALAVVGVSAAAVFVAAVVVAFAGPGNDVKDRVAAPPATPPPTTALATTVAPTTVAPSTAAPTTTSTPPKPTTTVTTAAPFPPAEPWAYVNTIGVPHYIHLADGATSTPDPGASGVEVSPDRSRIAFIAPDGTQYGNGAAHRSVFVAGAGGVSPQPVSDLKADLSQFGLAWSPDGSRVAYAAQIAGEGGSPGDEVVVVNADGTGRRQLTTGADVFADMPGTRPAWSRDGSRIAFVTARGETVDAVDVATGAVTTVAQDSSNAFSDLTWLPSGQLIALDRTGVVQIAADGASLRRVTRDNVPLTYSLSPDGKTVAYTGSDGMLRTIAVTGGPVRSYNAASGSSSPPSWSADGLAVLVASFDPKVGGTRAVRISDGAVVVVHQGADAAATW